MLLIGDCIDLFLVTTKSQPGLKTAYFFFYFDKILSTGMWNSGSKKRRKKLTT